MTFEDALQSPALDLLLRLEDKGFDLAIGADGLRVKPLSKLTPERRTAIREHREALIVLVRHCLELSPIDKEAE